MKRFVMCVGLPGSGKTFWADQQVLDAPPGEIVRVNRDSIRTMLHAGRWKGNKTEAITVSARNTLLELAMKRLVPCVISDDTNLAPNVQAELRALAAQSGYDFRIQDFSAVPLKTCIERDLKRFASVGEAVIRRMHNQYLAPALSSYVADPSLPEAWMVDVDGTLALMGNNRSPYEWTRVAQDTPNVPVIRMVNAIAASGPAVIVMSGRDSCCRKETESWLQLHGVSYKELYMRPAGDQRKDSAVKLELFDQHVRARFRVVGVIDDRNSVVDLWRSLGLMCAQVAPGSF